MAVVALAAWQALLDGMGWLLARIYDVVPNFGVTIIILTVVIRVVLLPLGIKQVKSMQGMQQIQPKVKAIQQKYKGNRQRQQEEIMALYKEHGVNPFSGCWPLLLQFPVLIAMYAVLRFPQQPLHLPEDSGLWAGIEREIYGGDGDGGTDFVWTNLLCSALQAGTGTVEVEDGQAGPDEPRTLQLDCGQAWAVRIPYYALALLMAGTTYYQTRQMQRASPAGSQPQQMQTLTRVMPIMFGVFGFTFPAGLVLYWTTSNVWQIGQQWIMLKAGHIGPQAGQEAGTGGPVKPSRPGLLERLTQREQRAEEERRRQERQSKRERPKRPGGGRAGGRKKRPKR